MAIITLANPKGGSGKTTAAVVLATTLASNGGNVSIIDGDPEGWASQWEQASQASAPLPVRTTTATEDTILDVIDAEAQRSAFVVVDPEGSASLLAAQAIAASDLVLIPSQASSLDAKGAVKALRLVANQARVICRPIAHRVLFTRTSAAIQTRAMRAIRAQLDAAGVPMMRTALVERAAFRDLLDYGGALGDLDQSEVANLDKAIANARAFAAEVIEILKESKP